MTEYEVGDVVNGHRFNGVKWIPLPSGTVTGPPPPPPGPNQARTPVTSPTSVSSRSEVQSESAQSATLTTQPSVAPTPRNFVWDGTTWVIAATQISNTQSPRDFSWNGTTWVTATQHSGLSRRNNGSKATLHRWTAVLSPVGTVLFFLGVFVGRPIGTALFGIGLLMILTSVTFWAIGRARHRTQST